MAAEVDHPPDRTRPMRSLPRNSKHYSQIAHNGDETHKPRAHVNLTTPSTPARGSSSAPHTPFGWPLTTPSKTSAPLNPTVHERKMQANSPAPPYAEGITLNTGATRLNINIASFGSIGWADHAAFFEDIHHAGGACVAEPEATLEHRSAGLLLGCDDFDALEKAFLVGV